MTAGGDRFGRLGDLSVSHHRGIVHARRTLSRRRGFRAFPGARAACEISSASNRCRKTAKQKELISQRLDLERRRRA
jgi:hypothetical protein